MNPKDYIDRIKLYETLTIDTLPQSLVIDLETTNRGPALDKLNPSAPANKMVLGIGLNVIEATKAKRKLSVHDTYKLSDVGSLMTLLDITQQLTTTPLLLIGHNIKFDLRYLVKAGYTLDNAILIWDTSVYEYMDSAQTWRYPSLEDTARKHGIPFKKDPEVVAAFETDGAESVDPDVLSKYCAEDVLVTYEIFRKQLEALPTKGWNKLFAIHCERIKVLTHYEHNGYNIDVPKLSKTVLDTHEKLSALRLVLEDYATMTLGFLPDSPTSGRTVSTLLYGVPGIPVIEKEQQGVYKNGKPKFHNVKKLRSITIPEDRYDIHVSLFGEPNPTLGYPITEESLNETLSHLNPLAGDIRGYITTLLEFKKLNKLCNTYLEPIMEWLLSTTTTSIHPSYNNTATTTARLSSSKPNGQNLPPEIEALIVPHVPTRTLVSADWKQLEVGGLAQISRDPTLIADLNNHLDIHAAIGAGVFSFPLSPAERRLVKGVNFGTIYGGGVNAISKQTGIEYKVVQKIQKEFFARYDTLKTYYNKVRADLIAHSQYSAGVDNASGRVVYNYGLTDTETGRQYAISQSPPLYDGPSWTQLRNYRIQGWSTADFMALFETLLYWEYCRAHAIGAIASITFIANVHDAIKLEAWSAPQAKLLLTDVKRAMPTVYKELFNVELVVPFELDITTKENASV